MVFIFGPRLNILNKILNSNKNSNEKEKTNYYPYLFSLELRESNPDYFILMLRMQKFNDTSILEIKNSNLSKFGKIHEIQTAESQELFLNFFCEKKILKILKRYLEEKAIETQKLSDWNTLLTFSQGNEKLKAVSNRRKIFHNPELLKSENIEIDSFLNYNPCYLPILKKINRISNTNFKYEDLFNSEFEESNFLKGRYVILDLNTTNEKGECRGTFDIYPDNTKLPEFINLFSYFKSNQIDPYDLKSLEKTTTTNEKVEEWTNYLKKVHNYQTNSEIKKHPTALINQKLYCFGQRIYLCEANLDTISLVAQFITSSKKASNHYGVFKDFDGQLRYYAPIYYVTTRNWDNSILYDEFERIRDKKMKGGDSKVITYQGKVFLPNFIRLQAPKTFSKANNFYIGFHEYAVGGKNIEKYMGSPESLGCIRLYDYPSKFLRWWIPLNAKVFVSYEENRYKNIIEKKN